MYKECHALSHTTSRLKADSNVNVALDNKLHRESAWSRKGSITVYSENVFNESANHVEKSENAIKYLDSVKKKVKNNIKQEFNMLWYDHIKSLLVQGRFIELLYLENNHVTWKSVCFNLPRNILKFAVNASIDTLTTNANLKR